MVCVPRWHVVGRAGDSAINYPMVVPKEDFRSALAGAMQHIGAPTAADIAAADAL
jgi:hypothetical protein